MSAALAIAPSPMTTGHVTSQDGTVIGYREVGSGPGLVILHGAFESALSHGELAEALADSFTVYLPDRRGRGASGPTGRGFGMRKELEDLHALMTATGAGKVLGVSAGALIALAAAWELPALRRAAIFEPPLLLDGSLSPGFLERFDRDMAAGNVAGALVTAMLGSQMGPPWLRFFPRWLLELLTRWGMRAEERKAKPGDITTRMLAPTLRTDFQLIFEVAATLPEEREIRAEILLLGGSQSPAYLRSGINALGKALPHARRVVFPGVGHGATGNRNRGGVPERAAQELRAFFL